MDNKQDNDNKYIDNDNTYINNDIANGIDIDNNKNIYDKDIENIK